MTHVDQQTAPIMPPVTLPWQRMLFRWAGKLRHGHLTLTFPDGREQIFVGMEPGPSASLRLNNGRAVWRILTGGSLGFARSFMDRDWDTSNIADLLELAIANEESLGSIVHPGILTRLLARLRHRLNRNSKSGSKRNIAFHYDLGNEFYATWLDQTMTYSSALFEHPDQDLADAQNAKYERILQKLEIGPTDHVLEIGCGWGGFAEYAIRRTGCHVTGLTLSKEQAAFARQRLDEAGMSDRSDIRIQDYRDCRERFTKIVSIEMFEAVGEENWHLYFNRVRDLLVKGGHALVQVITIDESRFEDYRRSADFIQTYIFPGGMLPSVTVFENTARQSGLDVLDTFRFGRDYEKTLLMWDETFEANWHRIKPLGFDERFRRMWQYYLHYCAVGFRIGRLDVVQFELKAP
ncbi:class I SAM-dependent methyltransferase [Agrobacterium sp. ES01]|uniref:class I SAM-dependent methyltransferase n=1 Tax=Agrobacterium sp. ES01 TaxID=3420714 RepID=UPI003D1130D2